MFAMFITILYFKCFIKIFLVVNYNNRFNVKLVFYKIINAFGPKMD